MTKVFKNLFKMLTLLTPASMPPQTLIIAITVLGFLHCAIGYAAAKVAIAKGGNKDLWIPVGLIAGTPALIAALTLKSPTLKFPSFKV
jgi:hypothetical protein